VEPAVDPFRCGAEEAIDTTTMDTITATYGNILSASKLMVCLNMRAHQDVIFIQRQRTSNSPCWSSLTA
jgi:hypothetical protein